MFKIVQPSRATLFSYALDSIHLEPCGSDCLLHTLPNRTRFYPHGSDKTGVIAILEDKLLFNISNKTHPEGHPLNTETNAITAEERASLLKKLVGKQALMHIAVPTECCNCAYTSKIVKGSQLVDYQTRPNWHKRLFPEIPDEVQDLNWEMTQQLIVDLATGLQRLHTLGIAHGDPHAFNAMLDSNGRVLWVDLNDCNHASDNAIVVDNWAFIHYTVIPLLHKTKRFNKDRLKTAIQLLIKEDKWNTLDTFINTLKDRDNNRLTPLTNTSSAHLAQLFSTDSASAMHPFVQQLYYQGLNHYWMAAYWNSTAAHRREKWLAAEKQRHLIFEKELHRLKGETINHLQTKIMWLEKQNKSLEHELYKNASDWNESQKRIYELQNIINQLKQHS